MSRPGRISKPVEEFKKDDVADTYKAMQHDPNVQKEVDSYFDEEDFVGIILDVLVNGRKVD